MPNVRLSRPREKKDDNEGKGEAASERKGWAGRAFRNAKKGARVEMCLGWEERVAACRV